VCYAVRKGWEQFRDKNILIRRRAVIPRLDWRLNLPRLPKRVGPLLNRRDDISLPGAPSVVEQIAFFFFSLPGSVVGCRTGKMGFEEFGSGHPRSTAEGAKGSPGAVMTGQRPRRSAEGFGKCDTMLAVRSGDHEARDRCAETGGVCARGNNFLGAESRPARLRRTQCLRHNLRFGDIKHLSRQSEADP